MTSSGTTAFSPSVADVAINALLVAGVKRAAVTPEHMIDVRMCANMLLAEWENIQPHLWTVELVTQALTEGTAAYTLPADTILALDVYISTTVSGQTTDRILYPIGRSDYAAYPNKETEGFPTVYWFDRLIVPTMTFYQTPDDNGPYTAKIYRVRQIQDANPAGAQTPDMARRFIPAFAAGLAARLSQIYSPDRYDRLEAIHKARFGDATIQDQENAPLTIAPGLSAYFN